MAHVFADILLDNPRRADLEPVAARALADTGALNLCIPQHLANQLRLETESIREVSMADGRMINVPYVGPLRVVFGKRSCFVGALVFGDEVLLGTVPMQDMDLIVDPLRERVTMNPASPNVPHARAKAHPDGRVRVAAQLRAEDAYLLGVSRTLDEWNSPEDKAAWQAL